MLKQLIELILVILVGLMPAAANSDSAKQPAAAETAVLAEVSCQQSDGIKAARFQNMLNHNYCFGEKLTEEQLIRSATVALRSKIKDGFISKQAVDTFVADMYGVTLSADGGDYAVTPCGFDSYFHTVQNFVYNGDGTITVSSVMTVNGEGAVPCVSVFFADGSSAFGYTLRSCVAEW